METKELFELFKEANTNFIKRDEILFKNGVSEICLCANLAYAINTLINKKNILQGYYCDVEYNRNGNTPKEMLNSDMKLNRIQCDLILHSRGTKEKDNLIALEMKKIPCRKPLLDSDRQRLICLTRTNKDLNNGFSLNGYVFPKNVCNYDLGIFYLVNHNKNEVTIEIYEKGEFIYDETNSINYYRNYQK